MHALDQLPDLTTTVMTLIAGGDLVPALVCARETSTGRLHGFLAPGGRGSEHLQTHRFRVTDGRPCEHRATRDDLSVVLQPGVVTRPRLAALSRRLRAAAVHRLHRLRRPLRPAG